MLNQTRFVLCILILCFILYYAHSHIFELFLFLMKGLISLTVGIIEDLWLFIFTFFQLAKYFIIEIAPQIFKCWRLISLVLIIKIFVFNSYEPASYNWNQICKLNRTISNLNSQIKERQKKCIEISKQKQILELQYITFKQQSKILQNQLIKQQKNNENLLKQIQAYKNQQKMKQRKEQQIEQKNIKQSQQQMQKEEQIINLNKKIQQLLQCIRNEKMGEKNLSEIALKMISYKEQAEKQLFNSNRKIKQLEKQLQTMRENKLIMQEQLQMSYKYQQCLQKNALKLLNKNLKL